MLTSPRTRILALLAAVAVVLTGVLVPVAASAAVAYPAAAPGTIGIDQVDTSKIQVGSLSGFPAGTTMATTAQWYRGSTALAGKTASVYTLVAADQNQLMKVRVTVNVPGFAPTLRFSGAGNFSFTRSGPFTISGQPEVGATLSGVDGMSFTDPSGGVQAPGRSYQWLINGVASGPAGLDFTMLPAHLGKTISLRATIENYGIVPQVFVTPGVTITKKRPISQTGAAVTVSKTVNPDGTFFLVANPGGDVDIAATGPTLQWYRQVYPAGAITAIAGQTTSLYTPTAADYNYRVFVKATWTQPDFQPLVVESFHKDYSVRVDDRGFGAVPKVDVDLFAVYSYSVEQTGDVLDRNGSPAGTDLSFTWFRSGVLVAPTSYSYPVTTSDVGKTITFAITAEFDGYLPAVGLKSPASAKAILGSFSFGGVPTFTVSPTLKISVTPSVTVPAGATITKYQWLRAGVAVSSAATYQLTSADTGKEISVNLTYSKTGYANAVENSRLKYYVQPSAPLPVIDGDYFTSGTTLYVTPRTYTNAQTGSAITPDLTYQWLRNGVAISGATEFAYELDGALDNGPAISVRVTATSPGLLPTIATSVAIPFIGAQVLTNHAALPTVAVSSSSTAPVLTATTGVTGPAGFVVKYQWYRGDTPVAGKTAQTYALTTADVGKQIWVRVTTTHAADVGGTYTTSVHDSVRLDYSLSVPAVSISTSGGFAVGDEISYAGRPHDYTGELALWTQTTQYLRNGVAIPASQGGVFTDPGLSYVLKTADVGAKISVRVTLSKAGRIPVTVTVFTSPASMVVEKAVFDLGTVHPLIDSADIGTLKVSIPGGVTPAPTSYTYKWLRNGTPITGKTAATYVLVAADAGKAITVQVAPVRAGYTSDPLPVTPPWDPDIDPSGPITLTAGTHKVGDTIGLTLPTYSTDAFGTASVFATYRWLRNGAVIAGQLGNTYTLAAADLNASIQAQAVITLEGHLSRADTSAGTFPIAKGHTDANPTVVVTVNPAAATLTASITGMVPATPAPALTYQWLRNGSNISKATGATYKPVAADAAALLSVRVTVNRGAAFDVPVLGPFTSDERNYSTHHGVGDQPLTISGTVRVGEVLTADFIAYVNQNGDPVGASVLRTWYRNGVAITGAVNLATQTYTVQGADLGKTITVRETASSPTSLPVTVASAGVGPVAAGNLTGSFDFATVTKNAAGFLIASVTPGTITQPPPYVLSYKWVRNSVTVLSTSSSYKLTAADTGHDVRVVITVGKIGYTTIPDAVYGLANWLQTDGEVFVINAGSPHVGTEFQADPPTWTAPGSPAYTLNYQWYRDSLADPITGATADSYTAAGADIGHDVFVRVFPVAPMYFGTSGAVSSDPISVIP